MKKALVVLFAVALLGLLGLYFAGHKTKQTPPMMPTVSAKAAAESYRDGTFTGSVTDTPYGTVQVAAVVSGGKITDVHFLQMPSDLGRSADLTNYSEPLLKQTTLKQQSAQIDFVSGATQTSLGYEQSLQAALDQAANQS